MSAKELAAKTALLAVGLASALLIAELVLLAMGEPRFYRTHPVTQQFAILGSRADGTVVWVNSRSARIRFVYDGNPRGYFGPEDEVDHYTNESGFRGGEFETTKPPGTVRIAFLGDSFTFGEGVRFEDTFPERVASLLGGSLGGAASFESYNFGVGGYNTGQALYALEQWALPTQPDALVLAYVLNDSEPSLYLRDRRTGRLERRKRPVEYSEGVGDRRPPVAFPYQLRVARLVWKFLDARSRTDAAIRYYRGLYDEANPGWAESRRALARILAICGERRIPCVVACFPLLVKLDEGYPFSDIHRELGELVANGGGIFVDLLPQMKGRKTSELWVHPADQHPNEVAHSIAARAIARALQPVLGERIRRAAVEAGGP